LSIIVYIVFSIYPLGPLVQAHLNKSAHVRRIVNTVFAVHFIPVFSSTWRLKAGHIQFANNCCQVSSQN